MKLGPKTLLIASPQLEDPYFKDSVVLILEHDDEETVGLILNRESRIDCIQIMQQFNLEWHGPHDHLLLGGPVDPKSLWMVHGEGWPFDHKTIFNGVSVSRSEEALSVLCHSREQRLNVYVGYAGWGAGQLEREIQEGSWLTVDIDADFIFEIDRNEMWSEALARLGIDADMLLMGDDLIH